MSWLEEWLAAAGPEQAAEIEACLAEARKIAMLSALPRGEAEQALRHEGVWPVSVVHGDVEDQQSAERIFSLSRLAEEAAAAGGRPARVRTRVGTNDADTWFFTGPGAEAAALAFTARADGIAEHHWRITPTARPVFTDLGDEVKVYAEGLFYASACAPSAMSLAEVTAAVNASHPCGTSGGWQPDPSPAFAGQDREPNPGPCNTEPGRTHYLFTAATEEGDDDGNQ